MPCTGCNEKSYDMKFIGWKDGRLIPTAPSGYKQEQVVHQKLHLADLAYWELTSDIPKLDIPKVKDGAYIEEVFTPEQVPEVDKELKHIDTLKEMVEADNSLDRNDDLNKLTVKELKERLADLGIEVKEYWKKGDLRARLEMASDS